MTAPIIAFSGKAGSGKSSAARYLAQEHGFTVRSFADALRAEVRAFLIEHGLPFEERHITGTQQDKAETFLLPESLIPPCELPALGALLSMAEQEDGDLLRISYRKLLQWWGTDYRRAQSHNYWLDRMAESIDGPTVIDDCRFPNEAEFVLARGGIVARIERPGLSTGSHPSETALDGFSAFSTVMDNDGDQDQLFGLVDYLCYCLDGEVPA